MELRVKAVASAQYYKKRKEKKERKEERKNRTAWGLGVAWVSEERGWLV